MSLDLRQTLLSLGLALPEGSGDRFEEFISKLTDHPARNTATLVGLATVLFYVFEKNRNPKVNDVWDSLIYCTTNLSVGYSDIFAKTPLGKILGSVLMTVGPAMAAHALDGPKAARRDPTQDEILTTLKQILAKFESQAPTATADGDANMTPAES